MVLCLPCVLVKHLLRLRNLEISSLFSLIFFYNPTINLNFRSPLQKMYSQIVILSFADIYFTFIYLREMILKDKQSAIYNIALYWNK